MVTYLGLVLLGCGAWLVFRARVIFGTLLSQARLQAGDYDGALRRMRWMSLGIPNPASLHREALILSLAGRPAQAEARYRKALAMVPGDSRYPRERLHAALGRALLDLTRYDEAERCFREAIEAGDATGNAQDGLAELHLVRGVEAGPALDYAGVAVGNAKRIEGRRVPGSYYAGQAWALALLGRSEEARETLTAALQTPTYLPASTAELHWRAGMALVAMQQAGDARRHFQAGRDADPRGKFGGRCAERLPGMA